MTQTFDLARERIWQRAHTITPEKELLEALEAGRKLNVKLGMDPTAPDLHLGHAVVLEKLADFQALGHNVIFIIGDFTARIGDPSGKSKTRPPLSVDEIAHNAKTYFEQVGRIIDIRCASIVYNSSWLGKFSFEDVLKLAGRVTLARIIERDDFQNRLSSHQPVGFHELFYPVMQGYDSVELDAHVELGGTDQTFNLLMGRLLQQQYGKTPQVTITMPILEGLDGVSKMSKSLGNYIGLSEPADEAFGKLMSLSDVLMWRYMSLLLRVSDEEIGSKRKRIDAGTLHPMDVKKAMAHDVVAKFWSPQEAGVAQEKFEAVFQRHDYSQVREVVLPRGFANPVWVVALLKALGAVNTSSDAKRLLQSGAVHIDNKAIADFKAEVTWGNGMIVRVGKHRLYKIKA